MERPLPEPTPTTRPFWNALAEDRMQLQHCPQCDHWVHYPRSRCPRCLGDRLQWRHVPGTGVVHTFTIARQATSPHFVDDVPQLLAIVELDPPCQDVRITTTLIADNPAAITIGARVEPVFDHSGAVTLLRYKLV